MQLSNIAITHISLVKSGANGKTIIYKSAKEEAKYENVISIKKTDETLGVVYGIVYSPDEVDSQGDTATALEIKKASYAFMKSLNATNVDVEHDFKNVDAFVAESWIIKSGDSVFPDEKEGAWAVAIQLESDELKAMAKSGEIAGLSMAGDAVKKASSIGEDKFKDFFVLLADMVSGISLDFYARVEKGEKKDMDKYQKEVKEKMQKACSDASAQLEELSKTASISKTTNEAHSKEINAQKEKLSEQAKEIEALKKSVAEKESELKALSKNAKEADEKIDTLNKESKEVQETLKKSTQNTKPKTKKDDTKGVL